MERKLISGQELEILKTVAVETAKSRWIELEPSRILAISKEIVEIPTETEICKGFVILDVLYINDKLENESTFGTFRMTNIAVHGPEPLRFVSSTAGRFNCKIVEEFSKWCSIEDVVEIIKENKDLQLAILNRLVEFNSFDPSLFSKEFEDIYYGGECTEVESITYIDSLILPYVMKKIDKESMSCLSFTDGVKYDAAWRNIEIAGFRQSDLLTNALMTTEMKLSDNGTFKVTIKPYLKDIFRDSFMTGFDKREGSFDDKELQERAVKLEREFEITVDLTDKFNAIEFEELFPKYVIMTAILREEFAMAISKIASDIYRAIGKFVVEEVKGLKERFRSVKNSIRSGLIEGMKNNYSDDERKEGSESYFAYCVYHCVDKAASDSRYSLSIMYMDTALDELKLNNKNIYNEEMESIHRRLSDIMDIDYRIASDGLIFEDYFEYDMFDKLGIEVE